MTYNFKDLKIPPIGFIKFKGPLHISKSIHNDETPLEGIENEQKKLKEELHYIKQRNTKNRSEEQKIEQIILKIFITQEKKLLKCLMIMLGTCLEIFTIQSKKEQGLRY